ncbi:MAG: hypothetical protein EXS05_23105 [Planctomycetaceae bacterium]|nr:hypothetical protein [Planctomycetaceae bacterium]
MKKIFVGNSQTPTKVKSIDVIGAKKRVLVRLCRRYHVRRLDLFGSATRDGQFDESSSDLDFLVEFDPCDAMGPADQDFGLLEALTQLFAREVDLVTARSLRNPYFIKKGKGVGSRCCDRSEPTSSAINDSRPLLSNC